MLYFLYGKDEYGAREKQRALLESLKSKNKEAGFTNLDSLNWSEAKLEELIYGRDLFGAINIVLINKIFELPEAKEFVLESLAQISESPNIFVVLEGTVDKPTVTKIQKHAEKVEEFRPKESSSAPSEFNVFGVTDALGERDRKKLWVLLQKAQLAGLEGEQIFWSLAWVVKSISIAQHSKSPEEAGLKPFVYQKCSRFGRNYTPKEVANLYGDFSRIYHECRRGQDEFGIALEKLALTI